MRASMAASQRSVLGQAWPFASAKRRASRGFIRGGRASVRTGVYMPALVAARFNPDLKAKYTHFMAAGKPAKVALTAIMRKLLLLANALLKARRKWTPIAP